MDVEILSRVQFALNISFHYFYPPLSIGLGLGLVIMEIMYLKTGRPLYKEMTKFWVKVFALIFAMGVATGLVQVFGFGTNWARFSRFVGDVFGSALGAEGIFAFFSRGGLFRDTRLWVRSGIEETAFYLYRMRMSWSSLQRSMDRDCQFLDADASGF